MTTTISGANKVAFDPFIDHSDDFLRDPYPQLDSLRQQATVLWSDRGNQWLVTGYDEAAQILRNNALGKRIERWKHPNPLMRFVIKYRTARMRSILIQDPPEHTRIRSLMNSAFTPTVVRDLEPHVQQITDSLIDDFAGAGRADIISQFAFPLPVTVIAELLGVPPADRLQFKQWSSEITASLQGGFCPMRIARSFTAAHALNGYFRSTIACKKREPQPDLLSSLIAVESQNDGRLTEQELIANSTLLLLAGHETTVNLIGNAIYHLLRLPAQRQLLQERPQLIGNAVEEFLRFDSPVQIIRRIANADVELDGITIKKSHGITVLVGGCNRDPRVHASPNELNIERSDIRHISFGAGIHFCLGAELARAEARIAISTLMRRLPELALARPEMPYKGPFALRGLQELLVTF